MTTFWDQNCKANSAAITASEISDSGVDADELGLTGEKVVGKSFYLGGKKDREMRGSKGDTGEEEAQRSGKRGSKARTGRVQTDYWSVRSFDSPAPGHCSPIFSLNSFLDYFLAAQVIYCDSLGNVKLYSLVS